MKNNGSQLPDMIFDWIGKFPFSTLSHDQQTEVLKHMEMEEYYELSRTFLMIKEVKKEEVRINHASKDQLLRRFDRLHQSRPVHASAFWKAAAVFLLLGAGWAYLYMVQQKKQFSNHRMAADTLYLDKAIDSAPSRTYDTAYIDHDSTKPDGKGTSYSGKPFIGNPSGTIVKDHTCVACAETFIGTGLQEKGSKRRSGYAKPELIRLA